MRAGRDALPNRRESADTSPAAGSAEPRGHLLTRRRFFLLAACGGILSFLATSVVGAIRFLYPRVRFEPSPRFKVGFPDEYAVGTVSTRWKKSHRVWIVRAPEGFYAILARCTHLGCTPGWFRTENKFKCFCHGSGFRKSGVNYEGPAPRALERVQIALADDGQLLIDKSVTYRFEKGEWEKPGAFLRI